ncbi:FAD-dependent oxidoreductase [Vogesella sp. LIG4]|uniref:FAD-dependent oxidoreductase n=1 Tax=Vogesella sp. LIG4 TaxID=1192162 RepID=UPI00082023DF|nr:FAD-dependent oxidoreductase [Vogesella sp. LIG4]SCK28342.1 putative aminophosphonate oxidoreductase [Vogesella sp. LIG4]
MTQRPFWLAQALAAESAPPQPPLQGEVRADVCIVGGGFTGLWTAILCRQARPDWRIVVLEKDICGSGASGRNGGCMLTWSTKYLSLARLYGADEAQRLVAASEQAVHDIAAFCRRHGIDADIRLGGAVYAASSAAQHGALNQVLAALEQVGRNRWRALSDADTRAASGSALLRAGYHSPLAGSLQPARLVRGLLRVARAMGVLVYEHSAMTALAEHDTVVVSSAGGRVLASQAVLALNVDTPVHSPQLGRSVLRVSSDMIITEPVPELIQRLGLQRGQAVCDLRTFVHYWRSTPDGRLMLGKGGNHIAFGNRADGYFDGPGACRGQLQQALARFFPALAGVPLAQGWTGASDRSASGFPFFGQLPGYRRVLYGMGYSGNGVVQSYLGGQILSSQLLGGEHAWQHSPLLRGPLAQFPPEPLRWCGAMLVRGAIRRVEQAQDRNQLPAWLDTRLAALASMAGKAD